MVLSVFAVRLVQLQGIDPREYAAMAAAEGSQNVVLPAERGRILDRNGEPLADSVDGLMIVADPSLTAQSAPELATLLTKRLDVDYFEILERLRARDSRFQYIARQVPATQARKVVTEAAEAGFVGLSTRDDPVRFYPGHDIAANLVGFLGTPRQNGSARPLAGLEAAFNTYLAGRDGEARYQVGAGSRIPLGDNTVVPARDGNDLRTTIDRDLQWYAQRMLRQTRARSSRRLRLRGRPGLPHRRGARPGRLPDVRRLAPDKSPESNYTSRVAQRRLRARLGREGAHRRRPHRCRQGHQQDTLRGSAGPATPGPPDQRLLRARHASPHAGRHHCQVVEHRHRDGRRRVPGRELRRYLTSFGLGQKTDVGLGGETKGLLPDGDLWTSQTADRIAFGQSLSVNALQMAAAVNTIANGGVRVDPSLVRGSAITDNGVQVGSDAARTRQVVSPDAARQTMLMMERVIDPEAGVAPRAAVPGYRVAGKTGTAQRVGAECGCYDGTFTVSFAGFAPADDPRFTIYVVVQNPRNGGGGGSVAGPAFSKLMGYTLRRYGVPPTGTRPSRLPSSGEGWGHGERPAQTSRPQHPPSTTLVGLAAWLTARRRTSRIVGDDQVSVTGLTLSSQRVHPGDLYAALPGARVHGVDFAAAAVEAGAVAVLTDAGRRRPRPACPTACRSWSSTSPARCWARSPRCSTASQRRRCG